jgi:hypothetical protein
VLDLDSFLVSLYVLVDDWWKLKHASKPPRVGRPDLPTDPEVITLARVAQWPCFRSERDFERVAVNEVRLRSRTSCFTCKSWGDRRDSNPRPSEPHSDDIGCQGLLRVA